MTEYNVKVEPEEVDRLVVEDLKEMYEATKDSKWDDPLFPKAVVRVLRFYMSRKDFQEWCEKQMLEVTVSD
jgi:DNA-binding TFAR19-related protein (PDSD5 family)